MLPLAGSKFEDLPQFFFCSFNAEPHQRGHRVIASNVCSKTVSYYVQSDPDMDHGCLYWNQPFLKTELNLTEH